MLPVTLRDEHIYTRQVEDSWDVVRVESFTHRFDIAVPNPNWRYDHEYDRSYQTGRRGSSVRGTGTEDIRAGLTPQHEDGDVPRPTRPAQSFH